MNIRTTNSLLAFLVSFLISYGFWSLDGTLKSYVSVGAFIFCLGTLVSAVGIEYEHARRGINIRVAAGVFFLIGLAWNGVALLLNVNPTFYIITAAVVFFMFIFIVNGILNTSQ